MQIRLESAKRIGRKIAINDEKGYVIAIFLVLIIVFSLVIGYFVVFRPQPEGYNTINLLDSSQKDASNYPEVLVANQNSTFSVWITVENHMGTTEKYQVQTKIAQNPITFPINATATNTAEITLQNGQSWQELATVTKNEVGSYSVVFELWPYEFTHDYCVLNIQVIS